MEEDSEVESPGGGTLLGLKKIRKDAVYTQVLFVAMSLSSFFNIP